ncbi:uncharacterized protein LOC121426618 [Lytechinus variegatus]|uniref:uncharacterized protein LOC121426618 n=1 Tax=Lytechinus variegatus TaxID=7654 RepID=UPI001BB0DA04|nr:uncharacterized protein LOC121426618 [Lytechinus variegatus]
MPKKQGDRNKTDPNLKWGGDQERAFQKSKELVQSDTVLTHCDPRKPLLLQCDASPYGLGVVLSHPDGDLSKKPKEYQMLVHLFSATSSPSCATFALSRTADYNKDSFNPDVCRTVRDNFYVDDCLKSAASKDDGTRVVHVSQLRELLQRGGFRLTKWISNNMDVLSGLPPSECVASIEDLGLDHDHVPTERTLGVLWDVETDALQLTVSTKDEPHTSRAILSATSSLYDPLGFVAPFM